MNNNKADKPTIPEVLPQFIEYYKKNLVWGSLHVVLEDGNYQDSHVISCIQFATERNDPEGVKLGDILLRMSKSQRSRIDLKVYETIKKST